MYFRHYGLKDKPFKLTHDAAYYYSAAHQVPLNELSYLVEERQGLATLVGEPGTGKTTLLRRLLQNFSPHQRGIYMSDVSLGGHSILHQLGAAVGVVTGTDHMRSEYLKRALTRAERTTVVLLIDEAQGLSVEQLAEIRHLTNLEAPGRKLLEIILAGQPSLKKVMTHPDLAGLDQRVAVRCRLRPLDLPHTRIYIEHRLRVARARDSSLFSPEAIQIIHEKSRGIPRLINIICERCLVVGYADDVQVIEGSKAREAIADLHMDEEPESTESPSVQSMRDGLLMRMGSRLENVETKLDILVQLLARAGFIRPELAASASARKYLEGLTRVRPTDTQREATPEKAVRHSPVKK